MAVGNHDPGVELELRVSNVQMREMPAKPMLTMKYCFVCHGCKILCCTNFVSDMKPLKL